MIITALQPIFGCSFISLLAKNQLFDMTWLNFFFFILIIKALDKNTSVLCTCTQSIQYQLLSIIDHVR